MDDQRARIKDALIHKGNLQQKVFDNTFNTFGMLKDVLAEMAAELNDDLEGQLDKRVKIEYRDRGKFECQIQVAGDMLVFVMHTDTFEFNRENEIWGNEYVARNHDNALCGVINIYNFLADSFKYNRNDDEGYLIGRIFVNHERQYCVEGKRQLAVRHDTFGSHVIDREALMGIVGTAVEYSLEFSLLVPPYDNEKCVSVEQMNTKFEQTKIQVGKRIGYRFNSDDV